MFCILYLIVCFFDSILGFNYLSRLIDDWYMFGLLLLSEWAIESFLVITLVWG